MVDLSLLAELLGVDERAHPRELVYAARVAHYTLPYLMLSVLERDGVPMGPASGWELARARHRAVIYDQLAAVLGELAGAEVVKGAAIAAHYPPSVLRAQGDLDLVVPDEAGLWRAVRWLLAHEPVEEMTLSLFGTAPRHLMVGISWNAGDPLNDPSCRVELSTAALTGDFAVVPIRARLPENASLAALLALAEERLQRAFHLRDLIDAMVLAAAPLPPAEEMLEVVGRYHLAPELAELLGAAGAYRPLGALAPLHAALPAAAERERDRRAALPRPDGAASVPARLADGQPVYGMELRRADGRDHWVTGRLECVGERTLLLTPVADYLLVAGAVVDPADYEAALRAVDGIGAELE